MIVYCNKLLNGKRHMDSEGNETVKTVSIHIRKNGKNRLERHEILQKLIARETLGFDLFSVLTPIQCKQVEIAIKYS